jgi:putative ABC transport system substrate-binding protein
VRWAWLFFIGALISLSASAAGVVQVMLSEDEAAYAEAARALQAALGQDIPVRVNTVAELGPEQVHEMTSAENLVVPIGLKATRYVAANHGAGGAVLGLMVPRVSTEKIHWPDALHGGRVAFVYIDQPLARSLELVQFLLPRKDRIGTVVSLENADLLRMLEEEAARRGLALVSRIVHDADEVGPALRRVLAESNVFLLLPDAMVLSGTNLQSLFLASFRQRVPVIGFSPGLVKTGAVAAVYSSPSQIGWQGGLMARSWVQGKGLPASQSAGRYSIDFNNYVARSLGLSLPPEREVAKQLGAED